MRTLHTALRVADAERSVRFYGALGYEVVGRVPESPVGALTMLKLPGDPFVAIELAHDPSRGPVTPHDGHIAVQVSSARDSAARLADAGFSVEDPVLLDSDTDFWTAWASDPDGYRIELVQWPAGHSAGMTAADFAS
ncbi:VOC family protein [Microbacterium sp. G2-8]|uniref:VOC family protein n=1 Tax=Microbacterium sp. G2-8 TaxID=2842454 RepID=UPI001C893D8D|nr:VOC family protein [Microbacterium sp. G2-8]